ncbi:MAG: hydrogenase maturation protease [Planctomycetaceae bacterium]|nr:hydrogenase maturation protease [Planctomycetaceae bacterium]
MKKAKRTRTAQTLVVGFGKALSGDQQAGLRVVQGLRKNVLPEGVEVFEGVEGCDLSEVFAGRRELILVDTVNLAGAAGSIVELSLADLVGDGNANLLQHADIRSPLALAYIRECAPRCVKIFGIIPASTNGSPEMSEEVRRQIPAIIRTVMEEVRNSQF